MQRLLLHRLWIEEACVHSHRREEFVRHAAWSFHGVKDGGYLNFEHLDIVYRERFKIYYLE